MPTKPKDPMYVEFGRQLKAIRESKGWTQIELANRIRMRLKQKDPKATFTKFNISNYEAGYSLPSIKHSPVILGVLDCKIVIEAATIQIVENKTK